MCRCVYELSLFYISPLLLQASLCVTTKPENKEEHHIARVWLFWILQKIYPPPPFKVFFFRLITMHHFNIQVEFFWDFLTYEDKISMLCHSFGSQLLSDTMSYPRRMDASAEPHCKPYNSWLKHSFFFCSLQVQAAEYLLLLQWISLWMGCTGLCWEGYRLGLVLHSSLFLWRTQLHFQACRRLVHLPCSVLACCWEWHSHFTVTHLR